MDRAGLHFDGVLVVDFPFGTTVTLRTNTATVDKYGDGAGTPAPTNAAWGPCAIAPRTTAENADNNAPAVVTGLTIYGPTVTITAKSQVVIATGPYAGTWDVEGLPGVWVSPFTGWAPGVEVAVTRASSL